jgi:hypothetical protein
MHSIEHKDKIMIKNLHYGTLLSEFESTISMDGVQCEVWDVGSLVHVFGILNNMWLGASTSTTVGLGFSTCQEVEGRKGSLDFGSLMIQSKKTNQIQKPRCHPMIFEALIKSRLPRPIPNKTTLFYCGLYRRRTVSQVCSEIVLDVK